MMRNRLLVVVWVWGLFWSGRSASALGVLPDVQAATLRNGIPVLLAEKTGAAAVHLRVLVRTGRTVDQERPSEAAMLLGRSLSWESMGASARRGEVDALLQKEEELFTAWQAERIRQGASGTGLASPAMKGLEASRYQLLGRLQSHVAGLGERSLEVQVAAGHLSVGLDLLPGQLGVSSAALVTRLGDPALAVYPSIRDQWFQQLANADGMDRDGLQILASRIFQGASCNDMASEDIAQVPTWKALRRYAKAMMVPEKLLLVVVGDIRMTDLVESLDASFGQLLPPASGVLAPASGWEGLSKGLGPQRFQVSIPQNTRLLLGWPMPPANHSDMPVLEILAQMLREGLAARLGQRPQDLQDRVPPRVQLGIPGEQGANLLVVEVVPNPRQGLAELEQAVLGEIARLQRGGFKEGEVLKAQRRVETAQLLMQEDASTLADALGKAVCEGGDWRLAFRVLQADKNVSPLEVQKAAMGYLALDRAVIASLEPDPLALPGDQIEVETLKMLRILVAQKIKDPSQRDDTIRETLRQLRMLPASEREQTLALLKAQVKP